MLPPSAVAAAPNFVQRYFAEFVSPFHLPNPLAIPSSPNYRAHGNIRKI
jgi:hypothetical protein